MRKKLVAVWLCAALVASALAMSTDVGNNVEGKEVVRDGVTYIASTPFRINSNADFATSPKVTGGNGTAGNPWLIENFDINGTGYGYCIYIGNTTDYFLVRDCYLHEASGNSKIYYENSGIYLYNTPNGKIESNNASNNFFGILLTYSSNRNTIANNIASSNFYRGINVYVSSNNTIANNTVSNNRGGIDFYSSNSNTIVNNTVSNNDNHGIYVYWSISNTLTDNTMVDCGIFIYGNLKEHFNTHTIDTSNTVNGKPVYYWKNLSGGTIPPGAGEVILANCTNVIVENQNVSDGNIGILLAFSDNNLLANNTASSNDNFGISLYSSISNTIANNIASNNQGGIRLEFSSSNTIANNTASNSGYGILLGSSSNNSIANNTVSSNNWYGITLGSGSSNNTIANNTISNSDFSISLATCSSNTITSNIASNSDHGITLGSSSNNTIANNTVSSNIWYGIKLASSSGNSIANNTISSNTAYGIYLNYSSSNTIADNTASNNGYGICLSWESDGNTIANNTISSNTAYGVYFNYSSSTTIYHNNIVNNTNQASDDTGTNQWNSTYPSGGNYWSDYTGVDFNSTSTQDVPPPDGIGDTPYMNIGGGAGAQDNYPLMTPWNSEPLTIFNISLTAGWNLVSIPLEMADSSIPNVLASISGQWDVVKYYNATDIMDPWKTCRVGSSVNDLARIDHTMGFWLHITNSSSNLVIYGNVPVATNILLNAGWNLVGYPTQTEQNVATALWGTGADRVEAYDPGSPSLISEVGPNYVMKPGEGYWVHVPADTIWTVDW